MGDVLADAEARIEMLGLERPVAFETDDDDPRAFLWWLLRMAACTHRRAREPLPPLDAQLVAGVAAALRGRPAVDTELGQLAIDPESTVRRALLTRELAVPGEGPILAVGDDDGLGIALAVLGERAAAVDADERVLSWLAAHGVDVARADVFGDAVPTRFAGRCRAVVTDPARSYDDCVAFLRWGRACLSEGAPLIWADHPDWTFEHDAVMQELPGLGLRCERVVPLVHAYPLGGAWLPDASAKAKELDVDPAWLAELLGRTRAWTHAYVLRGI